MHRFARPVFVALIGVASALGATPSVRAADLGGVYTEPSGACAERWVLGTITSRFRHQVHNVPNLPNVAITDFRDTRTATCQHSRITRSDVPIAARRSSSRTATAGTSGI